MILVFQVLDIFKWGLYLLLSLLYSYPYYIFVNIVKTNRDLDWEQIKFYEGIVQHRRFKPQQHKFRYPVRLALVNLKIPPRWFDCKQEDHLDYETAAKLSNTQGPIYLLTNLRIAGYSQNPISVYYCYSKEAKLENCIAAITNTPWAQRVWFTFNPGGDSVPKCLYVSPFNNMYSKWKIRTAILEDQIVLTVNVEDDQLGKYFHASFIGHESKINQTNEMSGLVNLYRYGFQPYKIAFWIYFQAIKLLFKGAKLYDIPSINDQKSNYQESAKQHKAIWRLNNNFPWK